MIGAEVEEIVALMALSNLSGIGDRRCDRLLETFGSAQQALEVPASEWFAVPGLSAAAVEKARASVDWPRARAQWASLEARGGRAFLRHHQGYPQLLRQLASPPPLLFTLGAVTLPAKAHCVAVVGTRKPSRSGEATARRLATGLAARGFCVVSGMASGIDAAAHDGALKAGGTTIAVLGSGVDVVTPLANHGLYQRIERHGAVVSDLLPGTPASTHTFPRRNRIISGLSLGTVLIEAPRVSGALITARNALEQGRQLFAVPGDVSTGRSAGCHQLIRDGAQLVESAEQIIDALRPLLPTGTEIPCAAPAAPAAVASELEPRQRLVLGRLGTEPSPVDELAAASDLSASEILDALSRLELAGLVDQLPGKRFCLSETVSG